MDNDKSRYRELNEGEKFEVGHITRSETSANEIIPKKTRQWRKE